MQTFYRRANFGCKELPTIIQVDNLTKRFGNFAAVYGVIFSIDEGELLGLLGPNGAGKTTTFHMLATLLKSTCGTALVNGYDINREPAPVRKSVGIVFQEPSSDDCSRGMRTSSHTLSFTTSLLLLAGRGSIKSGVQEDEL